MHGWDVLIRRQFAGVDRSLFLLLLRGGRRLPAKRESGEETAESGRVGCLCLLRRAGLLRVGVGVFAADGHVHGVSFGSASVNLNHSLVQK
jgi:hypothetical protein